MTLTKKERMRRALLHESVDRLPTQINYTQALGQKMARNYGVGEQDLPKYLGNHMVRVDIQFDAKVSEDGKNAYVLMKGLNGENKNGYHTFFLEASKDNEWKIIHWHAG